MHYTGTYLVRGDAHTLDALLFRLENEKVVSLPSPDIFAKWYRIFGVDDAADVRARSRTRPVQDDRRVFIIGASSMTTEAQNALLKTLEEPAADALLFLIVPSPETMLATIRSRTQMLDVHGEPVNTLVDADDFLAASAEKRITMLKPLYEHEDEGRDIGAVIAFLAAIERSFARAKRTPETEEGVRAVYRARKYATDRGSLLKSLLEQVALLAPRI